MKTVLEEARAFMQLVIDAEGENRVAGKAALRFDAGDQWDPVIKQQRQLDHRPCLTINKTGTFTRSVVNNMRKQRPRIKVHPVSDGAVLAVSKVIQGMVRHIEVASNADVAYDTGADYQTKMGWGYWRVLSKYVDEKSFEQELALERIRNQFSVYFDPSSIAPDGLDATRGAITGKMRIDDFEAKYPGKTVSSWSLIGAGDDIPSKDEITLLEYMRIIEKPEQLLRLSDGSNVWRSDVTDDDLKAKSLVIIDERKSARRVLKWSKLSGADELESGEHPGKYLRVIPVYGSELVIDGKCERFGMVKALMDPQIQYNFWRTSETEIVAMAPKAPWLMAEGQDEGHETEWDNANKKNYSSLKYKVLMDDGGTALPPPQRQQPQAIPAASIQAAMAASEDLKAVAGMFDPALGAPGQETSGAMVDSRREQSDLSNFHYYDNLTRSIRATGITLLDLIPHYYDTQRVIRIIGEDGTPDSVTINEQAIGKVLNDVTVGRYDVVMDTGPGYDTKRMEARDAMLDVLKVYPQIAQVGGDIILRQFDAPGMEALADRVAALIPAAQLDKQLPKDLDPKVRQFVIGLMTQLQQAKQGLQQLQQEKDAKVMGLQEKEHAVTVRDMHKEDEETHRLEIKEQHADHRAEIAAHTALATTDADNDTSWKETVLTAHTNLAVHHEQAMQKGVPDANRP